MKRNVAFTSLLTLGFSMVLTAPSFAKEIVVSHPDQHRVVATHVDRPDTQHHIEIDRPRNSQHQPVVVHPVTNYQRPHSIPSHVTDRMTDRVVSHTVNPGVNHNPAVTHTFTPPVNTRANSYNWQNNQQHDSGSNLRIQVNSH